MSSTTTPQQQSRSKCVAMPGATRLAPTMFGFEHSRLLAARGAHRRRSLGRATSERRAVRGSTCEQPLWPALPVGLWPAL